MTIGEASTSFHSTGRRQAIVDTALELAQRASWEAVRLHDVASELGLSLDDIRRHYREKEEIADAWFDGADSAMLQALDVEPLPAPGGKSRIERGVMAWLGHLEPHRKVARQIVLGSKLEPGHVHVQLATVFRISRTVQWLREASGRDQTYVLRALDETVLTSIFVTTVAAHLFNPLSSLDETRRLLRSLLRGADVVGRLPPLSAFTQPLESSRSAAPR